MHSKLMDRSNDELLTHVQTPSGRRFLESGPSPLQESPSPRTIAAPFARILWSVQIGIVMLAVALGLLFVSGKTVEEAREFFFIFGVWPWRSAAGSRSRPPRRLPVPEAGPLQSTGDGPCVT